MSDPLVEIFKHGELMLAVYQDVAQPSMRKVGKALETSLGLAYTVLLPIRLLNEIAQLHFTKFMQKYKQKLDDIAEDDIVDVMPEIALPILEKITYTTNNDIAELFLNLLTTASSRKTEGEAHPSFIHIINIISADEAKIINYFREKLMPIPIPMPDPFKSNQIPFIDMNLEIKSGGGYVRFKHLLTGIEYNLALDCPNNITAYLENLISHDILTMEHGMRIIDKKVYDDIENLYRDKLNLKTADIGTRKTKPGILRITNHGEMFILACTQHSK